MEILELYCELLQARIGLLDQRECDPGLEEAVKSIIYTATRTEIKELHQVREALIHKFSKEFVKDAVDNESGIVPEKVLKRLSSTPPSQELVSLYLTEIAKAYNAPFSELPDDTAESNSNDDDDTPDSGEKEKERRLSNLGSPQEGPKSPISVSAPHATTDNPKPTVKLDNENSNTNNKNESISDQKVNAEIARAKQAASKPKKEDEELDALRKRFDALRSR